MKRYEKKTTTRTTTHEECVELRCFICDDPAPQPDENGYKYDRGAWARGGYDIDQVIIMRRKGATYPHSGESSDVDEYDCCPNCWETIVKPFLDSLGKPDSYHIMDGERY